MNPGFVADASVAAAWVVESQSTYATDHLFVEVEAGAPVHVPVLWMLEVANALLMLRRRRRIDQQGYDVARADLRDLRPLIDTEGPQLALGSICELAEEHVLSVYDATYLELALRKTVPLASRDTALNKAAKRAGVRTLL
ncbi:MAG: type II toxin-antitoxin system VapC family toxin [Candidatus Sulfotelmatobacter sp.]